MTALVNLPWRGTETIAAANAILASHRDVELRLPAGYHHAVVSHFGSVTSTAGVAERVDVAGGVELLRTLAQIQGLTELAGLQAPAHRDRMSVRVSSPTPTVVIRIDAGGNE